LSNHCAKESAWPCKTHTPNKYTKREKKEKKEFVWLTDHTSENADIVELHFKVRYPC
jgi:hypothetical protein